MLHVVRRCSASDHEPLGDSLVRTAGCDELDDFNLSSAQRAPSARRDLSWDPVKRVLCVTLCASVMTAGLIQGAPLRFALKVRELGGERFELANEPTGAFVL
jgi:hypothetical protein